MEDELNLAIDAIERGDTESAAASLRMILINNPGNEDAWLWLATISNSDEQRRDCLTQALRINPANREARRGLAILQPKLEKSGPGTLQGKQENVRLESSLTGTTTQEIASTESGTVSNFAPPTLEQEEVTQPLSANVPTGDVLQASMSSALEGSPSAHSINLLTGILEDADFSPVPSSQLFARDNALPIEPEGTGNYSPQISWTGSTPIPQEPSAAFTQESAALPEKLSTSQQGIIPSLVSSDQGLFTVAPSPAIPPNHSTNQTHQSVAYSAQTEQVHGTSTKSHPVAELSVSLPVDLPSSAGLSLPTGEVQGEESILESKTLQGGDEEIYHTSDIDSLPHAQLATWEEPLPEILTQQIDETTGIPPLPNPPPSKFRKSLRRWERPFRTENDIVDLFPDLLDELLNLASNSNSSLNRQIESLRYAKKRYEEGLSQGQQTATFLAPAVQAAAALAESFELTGRHLDAFWTGNIFGEIAKTLIARNRQKYQETFNRLLLAAFCATIEGSALEPRFSATESQDPEIARLRGYLENICRFSLGTYFNGKTCSFVRDWQPDSSLAERLMNESLARHFDTQLRHLVQDDRPRVREYVTANLPIVYRFKLESSWDKTIDEWEKLLISAGYDDLIHYLKSTGILIRVDKVGQLTQGRLEDIRRAAGNNDLSRVRDLLKDSADELKSYLYSEAQSRLDYRQPPQPHLSDRLLVDSLTRAKRLADRGEPDGVREAFSIVQAAWERDISNLELRDWVAYLHAKTDNPKAAEPILEQIRKRRDPRHNFSTIWNLAVLAYDRKDEATAYGLLIPLLEGGNLDEDLVLVILALSLKLSDPERFLVTIPRTLTLRFHPLGIALAHDMGDRLREGELLTQLLRQSQKWELPPVAERFSSLDHFKQSVNKAIVEGQVDQLIPWLEARIGINQGWIPNYLALARVHEEEKQDIDAAFRVLTNRLYQAKTRQRDQQRVDEACRDLLELCKRSDRRDLGQEAYSLAINARASQDLLDSFRLFAPEGPQVGGEKKGEPIRPSDPSKAADQRTIQPP